MQRGWQEGKNLDERRRKYMKKYIRKAASKDIQFSAVTFDNCEEEVLSECFPMPLGVYAARVCRRTT